MDGNGECDPKTETTGGARGGGDENPKDYRLPDAPSETPEQRRQWEREGAKPKDPYAYQKLPQDDKDAIPMKEFPKEKKGTGGGGGGGLRFSKSTFRK